MSEREFIIQEAQGHSPYFVKESELKQRIFLLSRQYRALQPDKRYHEPVVPWEVLFAILLQGENQHDLPGCEEEAGPNWKGEGEKGEEPLRDPGALINLTLSNPDDQPSPTPTRQEWVDWLDRMPDVCTLDWNYTEYRRLKKIWFLSMPIVPKS
jgi:hypothetical protein